jgi:hypothetical protein
MLRVLFVALLLAPGCSDAPTLKVARDAGLGHAICPDHPAYCEGRCCGSQCVDLTADNANCGDCGNACPTGQSCLGGHCSAGGCGMTGAPCGAGQTCCSMTGCRALDSDPANCGSCGNICDRATKCTGGKCLCGNVECTSGQKCCSGTCAATCNMPPANPDMATSGPLPDCDCSRRGFGLGCLLFGPCIAKNCCAGDGTCKADPNCNPS